MIATCFPLYPGRPSTNVILVFNSSPVKQQHLVITHVLQVLISAPTQVICRSSFRPRWTIISQPKGGVCWFRPHHRRWKCLGHHLPRRPVACSFESAFSDPMKPYSVTDALSAGNGIFLVMEKNGVFSFLISFSSDVAAFRRSSFPLLRTPFWNGLTDFEY